jgi:hypothetical protein
MGICGKSHKETSPPLTGFWSYLGYAGFMSASMQLELPEMTVRLENGLIVETVGESRLCGRELLIAVLWKVWNERSVRANACPEESLNVHQLAA